MALLTNLLLLVCATIPIGLATPVANPVPNPVAIHNPNPIVSEQPACTTTVKINDQVAGWPGPVHGVGGSCTAGTAGCSISLAKGYSYGVTWAVGAELGLTIEEVVDVGITGGVHWTTTTSTTETVTVECPDGSDYVCGMAFSASMLYITGHVVVNSTDEMAGEVCSQPPDAEFAVEVPRTTGGSSPLPMFRTWACSCTGKSSLPACSFECDSVSQFVLIWSGWKAGNMRVFKVFISWLKNLALGPYPSLITS